MFIPPAGYRHRTNMKISSPNPYAQPYTISSPQNPIPIPPESTNQPRHSATSSNGQAPDRSASPFRNPFDRRRLAAAINRERAQALEARLSAAGHSLPKAADARDESERARRTGDRYYKRRLHRLFLRRPARPGSDCGYASDATAASDGSVSTVASDASGTVVCEDEDPHGLVEVPEEEKLLGPLEAYGRAREERKKMVQEYEELKFRPKKLAVWMRKSPRHAEHAAAQKAK